MDMGTEAGQGLQLQMDKLLVHSQLCDDERVAFALQMTLLGCKDVLPDVVDGFVTHTAAAHNAQAARLFAHDAALAEREAAMANALALVATDDCALAQEYHQAELKKGALARLDRELAVQIERAPHADTDVEQALHPEAELASRLARDVAAAERVLGGTQRSQVALVASHAELIDTETQESAFRAVDAHNASRTSGKATAAACLTSSTSSASAATRPSAGLLASSTVSSIAAPWSSAGSSDESLSINAQVDKSSPTEFHPPCMICLEERDLADCVFPMVQRQPKADDLVLARFKPTSNSWRSAVVVRASPGNIKQPWASVTFDGFHDEVVLPWDRLRFASSADHLGNPLVFSPSAVSRMESGHLARDDGAVGWACGHCVCIECFESYLEKSLVSAGKSEVKCCQLDCIGIVTMEQCTEVLGPNSSLEKLKSMQAENALGRKAFCVNKSCGAVFDATYATLGVGGAKNWPMVQCPRCKTSMCVDCHVPWHKGLNCTSFNQLPEHLKDEADLALLRLASEEQFRKCPSCGELIVRHEGDCNWIKCRCSCKFCYGCGAKYKNHTETANNVHGTPGCKCGLFTAVKPYDDAAAVIMEPQNNVMKYRKVSRPDGPYKPGEKVKFYKGMQVLPVPCKFSRTHKHCPWGKRCWYTHEDDDTGTNL
jgi:hypothetical protein